jgi:hypothetical protein
MSDAFEQKPLVCSMVWKNPFQTSITTSKGPELGWSTTTTARSSCFPSLCHFCLLENIDGICIPTTFRTMISSPASCRWYLSTAIRRSMMMTGTGRTVSVKPSAFTNTLQFTAMRSLVIPTWSVAMPVKTINVSVPHTANGKYTLRLLSLKSLPLHFH